MKILIVGGSSFIGKNTLLRLSKKHDVIATYYTDPHFMGFLKENELNNVTAVKCNLMNISDIKKMFKKIGGKIDVALYLASNKNLSDSVINPLFDLDINVRGMVNFLECYTGGRLIFFSSGAVYYGLSGGVSPKSRVCPTLPFAITKLAAEYYVKFYKKRRRKFDSYIIVRFFGAYGPYEQKRKIYTRLVESFHFKDENSFTIRGDGRNFIDAMYVDDAVNGMVKILESYKSDLVVDFCLGNPLTINQLVTEVAKILGKEDIMIKHSGKTEEYINYQASPSMFEKEFGFKPKINLETGIKKFANFLEKERRLKKEIRGGV